VVIKRHRGLRVAILKPLQDEQRSLLLPHRTVGQRYSQG
jgi:hypothetical protein